MTTRLDDGPDFDPDDPLTVILRPSSADYLAPPPDRYETIRRSASRRRLRRATAGVTLSLAAAALIALPLHFAGPERPSTPTVPMAPPPATSPAPPRPSVSPSPEPSRPTPAPRTSAPRAAGSRAPDSRTADSPTAVPSAPDSTTRSTRTYAPSATPSAFRAEPSTDGTKVVPTTRGTAGP